MVDDKISVISKRIEEESQSNLSILHLKQNLSRNNKDSKRSHWDALSPARNPRDIISPFNSITGNKLLCSEKTLKSNITCVRRPLYKPKPCRISYQTNQLKKCKTKDCMILPLQGKSYLYL